MGGVVYNDIVRRGGMFIWQCIIVYNEIFLEELLLIWIYGNGYYFNDFVYNLSFIWMDSYNSIYCKAYSLFWD